MRISFLVGAAVTAALASAVAGYRFGAGDWPHRSTPVAMTPVGDAPPPQAGNASRAVLYWKHPGGAPDYSPTPARTADGQEFIPVYDDEEKSLSPAPQAQPKTAGNATRKVRYYRNPMGLPDTSPVPKKDWMGMDYIPVYDGDDDDGSTVKISLDKVQRTGVRTQDAQVVSMARPVRAPGIAKPDERTLRMVTLRADAFIEKLYVNETGAHVKAGDPLFRVYSPDLLRALVDLRSNSIPGLISAEQKLRILQVPPDVVAQARAGKEVAASFDFPSPASGVVMEKMAVEGMMVKVGEPLYRMADLSSIWVIADVAEQDLAQIKIGDPAKVAFRALPGETFSGAVTFILHELDAATRTAKVRIEIKNPLHRIRHEMYADVEIGTGAGEAARLAVPHEAIIDNGNRQVVLVARGEGLFEPRPVRIGRRGEHVTEILSGLKSGEKVVISGNFLIDAESNLKAALSAFTADKPSEPPPGQAREAAP